MKLCFPLTSVCVLGLFKHKKQISIISLSETEKVIFPVSKGCHIHFPPGGLLVVFPPPPFLR